VSVCNEIGPSLEAHVRKLLLCVWGSQKLTLTGSFSRSVVVEILLSLMTVFSAPFLAWLAVLLQDFASTCSQYSYSFVVSWRLTYLCRNITLPQTDKIGPILPVDSSRSKSTTSVPIVQNGQLLILIVQNRRLLFLIFRNRRLLFLNPIVKITTPVFCRAAVPPCLSGARWACTTWFLFLRLLTWSSITSTSKHATGNVR
jgi:hypothetical protein